MNTLTARVSVLNNTYAPLGETDLPRAIALVFKGDAVVDQFDENRPLRMVDGDPFYVPLVIRMVRWINVDLIYAEESFGRAGVLRRDNYTCGYCGIKGSGCKSGNAAFMTLDHITPKSKGGRDEWMNAITACTDCNSKKRNRTPAQAGMPLLFEPTVPKRWFVRSNKARRPRKKS